MEVALIMGQLHPDIVERIDILARAAYKLATGENLEPLGEEWLLDLRDIAMRNPSWHALARVGL